MLTGLDHIVLICADLNKAVQTYETLLGRSADHMASSEDGPASALFVLDNTALELLAPTNSDLSQKFSKMLDGLEGQLTSLAFGTKDLTETHRVFARRGLNPSPVSAGESQDKSSRTTLKWNRFRCPDEVCAGIKTFVLERETRLKHRPAGDDAVNHLDHLVINTPNPERAIAHYGARLGLRFALDRTIEAFKTRFLFFRIGGLTLEIIHRLDDVLEPDNPDRIWGLTWKVADLSAAHQRLRRAGLEISDIRTGRKPGTQVFTVRDGTLDIPTLFLSHS